MTLRVIGTGFGRTGTDSMREALGILGYGPCHHMYEASTVAVQKQRWRALAAGAPADWPSRFEGYASRGGRDGDGSARAPAGPPAR